MVCFTEQKKKGNGQQNSNKIYVEYKGKIYKVEIPLPLLDLEIQWE